MDLGSALASVPAAERGRIVSTAQELEFANKEALMEYMQVVRDTLVEPEDLSELLGAAPFSIRLLGSCFIASTSQQTSGLTLKQRAGGFKHLSYASLNANLLECTHIGTKAFMVADRKLRDIATVSRNMFQQVDRVLAALNDEIGIKKFLAYEMQVLKEGAETCQTKAFEIQQAFDAWLDYVFEFKEVISETSTDVGQKEEENLKDQLTAEDQRRVAEEIVKDWETDVNNRREEVKRYDELFRKTLDKFPSSAELTKAFITQALTDAAASAMQAITASYSAGPMTWLGNMPAENVKDKEKLKAYQESHVEGKGATSHVYDTAYSDAIVLAASLKILRSYLFGSEAQPDWSQMTGPNLELQQELIDGVHNATKRTGTEASNDLLKGLQLSRDLLQEVLNFVKSSDKSEDEKIEAPAEKVKEWRKMILEACEKVFPLESSARAQPGSAPIPRPDQSADSAPPAVATSGSLAELLVSSASQKLEMQRRNLESARAVLIQSLENLSERKEKLGAIMAELTKLRADNATLKAANAVLKKCAEVLGTLALRLRRLVSFFQGIVSLTEDGSGRVKAFVGTISIIAEPDPSITTRDLIHHQRWNIVTHTIMSRAYFTVLREVAIMYTDISSKHIMPGLDMLDDLSTNPTLGNDAATKALTDKKIRQLQEYAEESQQGVFDIIATKYTGLVNNVDTLLQANASKRDLLPILTSDRKAIQSGAEDVTKERVQDKKDFKPPLLNPITIKFE